jgi:Undecaprenyl-phosphate glucose phosphotransferase
MTAAFSHEDMHRVERGPINRAFQDNSRLIKVAETLASLDQRPAYSPVVVAGLVKVVDFFTIVATGFLVHALYISTSEPFKSAYAFFIPMVAALAVLTFETFHLADVAALRRPLRQGFRLVSAWSIVMLGALAAIFFAKLDGTFSRVWLASWFVAGFAGLLIERIVTSMIVRRLAALGRLERRTVVVGGGEPAEQLLRELEKQSDSDVRIIGIFDDRMDERSPDMLGGYPKLGKVDELVEFARHTRVDLVIFALPITAEARLLQMLRKLWVLPIDIRLSAHTNKLRFRPRSYSYIGSVPVLDVFDKPIADWDVVMKWAFDKVVGALALIALSPVMALTALAVKLDSKGPVLFKQKRHGFNNELIEVFKFRSMYVDQCDAAASKLVTKGDPRVTRVGRIIRKTSLDELPQLFNVVFKGNLSLVGPRPHAVSAKAANVHYDEVVDGYFARHRVRPGITGWAQVNGWRGETDTQEKIEQRVAHDLYYIENWSLLFDAYILAITPVSLLSKNENAY